MEYENNKINENKTTINSGEEKNNIQKKDNVYNCDTNENSIIKSNSSQTTNPVNTIGNQNDTIQLNKVELNNLIKENILKSCDDFKSITDQLVHQAKDIIIKDTTDILNKAINEINNKIESTIIQLQVIPNSIHKSLIEFRNSIIERIEDPKGRVAFRNIKTLLNGFLSIYDMVNDYINNYSESIKSEEHLGNYKTLLVQLGQMFSFNDIKLIKPKQETKIDPKYHRAITIVETENELEDNCIVKCIREGFYYDKSTDNNIGIIRYAEVCVKKYNPSIKSGNSLQTNGD